MKKILSILLICLTFGFSNSVFAQTVLTFTTTGTNTWVCPAGVTTVTVQCWGGGGSGGGTPNSNNLSGGGGGGGAYASGAVTVVPGTSYNLVVGAGGTGNGATGGAGVASTFNTTSIVAVGGDAGTGNVGTGVGGSGGAAASCTGTVTRSGGNGANGVNNTSGGGGGGGAGTTGGGGNATGTTAGTGTTVGGGNGGAGITANGAGNAGVTCGGGGGGSKKNGNGGNGARGQVILSFNCPTYSLTSTAASTPIFTGSGSTITLTSSAAGMPVGVYTVTYNLSAPNAATGLTSTFTVSTAGSGTFTTSNLANAGTTTITITNLSSSTTTACNSTISTNNTSSIVSVAPPTYCTNTGGAAGYYINSFSTTGGTTNISNTSGGLSASGYGNFTGQSASAMQGTTITFSITTGSSSFSTYGFGIWIDWNQDGDFSDAGEAVYNSGAYSNTTTGTFTVPLTALSGSTRMRVVSDYYSSTPVACPGDTNTECEDYTFTVITLPVCSGTPTGGNAVASGSSICSGSTVDLSVTGASTASSLTYQWQSSPDNSTWTNIGGATAATYTATITATTYFRRVTTCTPSGLSGNSASVLVTMPAVCYCTNTNTTNTSYYISNFTTTGGTTNIANSTGFSANGYGNYTGMSASAMQGNSVNFSITETGGTMHFGIWIDWNQDGDFSDAGENVYINNTTYNTTVTGSFSVPVGATVGNTRMRVVGNESGTVAECTGTAYTECEDYTFTVIALPLCSGTPTAGTASSSIANFCNTGTPVLSNTGYTVATGIGFQWYSSPTNSPYAWSAISGATASTYTSGAISQTTYYRCEVTCNASSAFTNTLTVTNTASTITSTNSPVTVACNTAANMTATASGGTINWYTSSTGGTAVATGGSYAPTVTANTTYYCTASSGGSTCNTGKPSWTAADGYFGTSNWGIRFDALAPFTLVSVKVYVQTAGSTVGIQLQDNTGANIGAPVTTSATVAGINTITLNMSIPLGTGYRLVSTNSTNLGRGSTGVSFPYTCAGVCSVTSSEWGGSTTGTYYFFYDWVVSTACESSPRTPVNVIVTGATAPVCSAYSSPTNGATAVCPVATTINWLASSTACRAATSYKLYFGTDAAATNIINGTDIGNVLTYNLGNLSALTTYYWKIVPTNSGGDATGCAVQSFVTAASPGSICPGLLGTGVTSVASLPYSAGSGTTAGSGDNLTSANTTTCGSTSYLTGEDKVWYFTPTASGTITINLTSSGSYTGLMLYDGCPLSTATCGATPGSCVASATDYTGNKTLTACVTAGVTYYLILDSYASPATNPYSNLTISAVTPLTPAANDLPCNATALTLGVSTNGNNSCTGSTNDPNAPSCWTSGIRNTVWYTIVAPASGQVTIRTQLGTLTNTQIALYQGSCSSLTQVSPTSSSCNDNVSGCGSSQASQMSLTGLTPGATYYLVVDGANDLYGSFSILAIDPTTMSLPSTPGQDCSVAFPTCNSVLNVSDPGYANTGSTCDFDGVNDCTGGERASVWYTIDIQAAGSLRFDIIPNDWDGTATNPTDYDFLVWKTAGTGATTCAGIQANSANGLVACNYSYLGVTGLSATGNCGLNNAFNDAYEAAVAVAAGEQYMICISNFTGSTSGFQIDYTGTTGSAIDYTPSQSVINWTGTSTTAWATAANWGGCSIPTCAISAVVGGLVPRFPVISANQTVNDLTINAGATLTINAGVTLTVCGNFINNGTLIMSPTATLLFNNTASHLVSGSLTGTNAIGNITVTQTAGSVTFQSDIDIAGTLTTSNATSVINSNGRYVKLAGNFVNANGNTTYSNTGTVGTLEFNGTGAQTYTQGSSQLDLNRVVMNNSGTGLTLLSNMYVKATTGTLTFTNGKITTNAFEVNVANTTPACVSTGVTASYVNGNLRRYLAAGATGSFDFPVGNAANFERANVTFTSAAAAGAINLLARFDAWGGGWTQPGAPGWGPDCFVTYNMPYLNNGYWSIDASSASTGLYDLTLYNTGYSNAAAGFSIAKSPSGSPAWALNGTCVASPVTAVQRTGMSGFSKFGTIQSSSVLPVQFLGFTGINKTTYNELKWESASEENISHYELESSVEGSSFKKIYSVSAAGNKAMNKHSFDDYYFYSPVTFYRVKAIGKDGNHMYSHIVVVENKQKVHSVVKIFPNPATSQVNISMDIPFETDLVIEIKDILGRIITSKTVKVSEGTQTINLSTTDLSEGTYIISTSIENLPNTNNQLIITK